jgi:hypothetical protein
MSLQPNFLLPERDAARYLGMSAAWLQRHRWLGTGPAYIKHGRAVRYERTALDHWISEHRVSPAQVGR